MLLQWVDQTDVHFICTQNQMILCWVWQHIIIQDMSAPKNLRLPLLFHSWQMLWWLQLYSCPAAGSSPALSACMPLTLVKGTGSQIHSPPFSLAVDLGAIFIWAAGMDLLWLQAVKKQLRCDSKHSKNSGEENIWAYDWNFACKILDSGSTASPPRYRLVVLMTWSNIKQSWESDDKTNRTSCFNQL